jgi:hypothetical protein
MTHHAELTDAHHHASLVHPGLEQRSGSPGPLDLPVDGKVYGDLDDADPPRKS